MAARSEMYDSLPGMAACLATHPALACTATLVLLYIGFYLLFVVHRPRIHTRRGKGCLADYLLARCPILSQYYWPTFWAWHYHGCTILRPLLQKTPVLSPSRQEVDLKDGGIVALDWFSNSDYMPDTPILLILPGLTGSAKENYIRYFVLDGLSQGYRTVVFNQRGNGDMDLRTPRLYCASNTEDLREVLNAVCDRFPTAPVAALGVSLGGMILIRYLIESGVDCCLRCALTFSVPWNGFISRPALENDFFNRHLYQAFLVRRLKQLTKRNLAMLKTNPKLKIDQALQCAKTVSEFDSYVIAPMFDYSSCDDYYSDVLTNVECLDRIRVPLLSFTAADDPFIPPASLPLSAYESNPLTVMVVTKRGGHFGYLEGVLPNRQTWMNRATRHYLAAMKNYSPRALTNENGQ